MLESLMYAREALDTDLLISYADLVYTRDLVTQLIQEKGPIVVAVDSAWRQYWIRRFGSTEEDLETLTIENHQIIELGKEVISSSGIDYRYIGIMKFSKEVWPMVHDFYKHKQEKNEVWKQSGIDFRNGYMTDLLNELIQEGVPIVPSITEKQWLEFDTVNDYEMNITNLENGTLSEYFDGKL
jgi:choline kinase